MSLAIEAADVTDPRVLDLIERHLELMRSQTPPESVYAIDASGLARDDVSCYAAWHDGALVGFCALREIAPAHGEIKSMHTLSAHRGAGTGAAMLSHLVDTARARRYRRLSLETGRTPAFADAQRLYARFGFEPCGPFGEYDGDPHSLYMTLALSS